MRHAIFPIIQRVIHHSSMAKFVFYHFIITHIHNSLGLHWRCLFKQFADDQRNAHNYNIPILWECENSTPQEQCTFQHWLWPANHNWPAAVQCKNQITRSVDWVHPFLDIFRQHFAYCASSIPKQWHHDQALLRTGIQRCNELFIKTWFLRTACGYRNLILFKLFHFCRIKYYF